MSKKSNYLNFIRFEHLKFGYLRLFRIGPAGRFARISCFEFLEVKKEV